MPPYEPLNYESLRRKQQLERGSPRLTRLEGDFYVTLEAYLKGLNEDLQREVAQSPGSAKATLLQDELQNTRRLAEDLYEHRERKIIGAAVTAARGSAQDTTNMLRQEQELYEALINVLRDTKRRVLHGRAAAPAPKAAPPPEPVQPQGAPVLHTQAPSPQPQQAAPLPEGGRVLVRVLEDIGSFAASDLRTYHVRREEVLSLPADTARILILRGKAVEVTAPA